MKRTGRTLRGLHEGVLIATAVLTIPALATLFLSNMTAGLAAVLASAMPVWGWMIGAWSAGVVYFCACMVWSTEFREALLGRLSGFKERDEREELVAAKAARSVYLVTLAGFLAAGLLGMVRLNVFDYARWEGRSVPPLAKVGPYELRRGKVTKTGLIIWPSLGLPIANPRAPESAELERGNTLYFYAGGPLFGPEVARTFFALALLQILLFQLFARRVRV